MSDLRELLERVEACQGPDRELDRLIALAVSGATEDRDDAGELRGYHRDGFWVSIGVIEPVTASVDAALALIGRIFPGCWYHAARGRNSADEPLYGAILLPEGSLVEDGPECWLGGGEHEASLALALCSALLAAKVQEKTDD